MASHENDPHFQRRWLILAVLGLAQLMVVLDATIVNIALPSAQGDLGFSDADRQWIVTAYALAFGSLLLVGGRIGDLFGRKNVFIAGLIGFSVASAVGGFADSFGVLVAARAVQGAFGALLAPAALGLMTIIFSDPKERGKAFGIFGALAGSGAAIGLLLGGVLTEYLSWRWCLFVNLFMALAAVGGAVALMHQQTHPNRPKIDWLGTILSTVGLFCLVFGFAEVPSRGWGSSLVISMLVLSVILLVAFAFVQNRSNNPLLPPRIVLDRNRGAAYAIMGLASVGMFAIFLFLTFYLQGPLHMKPIVAGLAFLPMTFMIMFSAAGLSTRFLPRFGPKPLVLFGLAIAFFALLYLTRLDPQSSYAGGVLPSLMLMGFGMGFVFAPAFSLATLGIDHGEAGVASAMVNTMQQVGGSIGTALLNSIATTSAAAYVKANPPNVPGKEALGKALEAGAVHSYTVAFFWAAGFFTLAFLVTLLLMKPGVPEGLNVSDEVLIG